MKLLLTGLPGAGKTTLLRQSISGAEQSFWVICAEIRNKDGQRVGFEAETSTGLKGLLAHKHDIASEMMIGDYHVDVAAIDYLLTEPIKEATKTGKLLIIDEIGRMQMLSSAFGQAMRDLFNGEANVIATIRYGDDWAEEFTDRPDVVTLVLTQQNREEAALATSAIISAQAMLGRLSKIQQQAIATMAQQYARDNNFIRLKKLYKNAVKYLAEERIHKVSENEYNVGGDHGAHVIVKQAGAWSCDCDLFHGRGPFMGRAGECSHIQAVILA